MFRKWVSAISALCFLFAVHFCLAECAFASEEHNHHASEDKKGHSESGKHDAVSLCCSSLVAVKNFQNDSSDAELGVYPFFKAMLRDRWVPQEAAAPGCKFEFPPWVSPSPVYLLTYFNHAPPVSF